MIARSLIAGQVPGKYCLLLVLGLALIITGCEDTDFRLAAEAGSMPSKPFPFLRMRFAS